MNENFWSTELKRAVRKFFFADAPARGLVFALALLTFGNWTVCAVSLFSLEGGLSIHWPSVLLFAVILAAMNLPKLKERVPAVAFVGLAALAGILFRMVD